jgi:DNA-directed RNA polymerase sigma subunit (sigma70/sigma32)
LDIQHGGNIRIAFKDIEPHELEYSCSLDIADGGQRILDEMATVLGVTRERTRQIYETALRKLRVALEEHGVSAHDVFGE